MPKNNDSSSKLLAALFAEQRIYTVAELTGRIKDMLEAEFFSVQVQGEVSNYKRHQSGHWYFTLKDSDAQLRAVFFKQWNRLMRFEPENGLEARLRGRISVYEPRGEYQIIVETLEPVGVGALQLAFEQQVKRLAAEGLFDQARKRPFPIAPRRIGIVTSPVGSALHDMLNILSRRNSGVDVIIAPARVQGNGAAQEIAEAIRLLNKFARQTGNKIDAMIVGRGGGSMEDLWAFNEESVARAIFESDIPVISAVGHETDFTIADFVADLRAPTPSAAAEMVTAESAELRKRVSQLELALSRSINFYLLKRKSALRDLVESRGFAETAAAVATLTNRRRLLEARALAALKNNLFDARLRVNAALGKLESADFRTPLAAKNARFDSLCRRMDQAICRVIENSSHKLEMGAGKLDMLSPLAVLARGYAIVKDMEGRLVSRAAQVTTNQILRIRFEDGETACKAIDS